jgi:hypothetical protein
MESFDTSWFRGLKVLKSGDRRSPQSGEVILVVGYEEIHGSRIGKFRR